MAKRRRRTPGKDRGSEPKLLQDGQLRGCNVHHRATVFSLHLDPGFFAGMHTADAGPDFAARFVERFGDLDCLAAGGCLPEATRSALAVEPGLPMIDALLAAILAIERFAAHVMGRLDEPQFSRILQRDSVVELVWESHSAALSRAAARAALVGIMELLSTAPGGGVDATHGFAALLARLRRRRLRRHWSTTVAVLALAAKRRGTPHEVLAGTYLRLGEGSMQHIVSESSLGIAPHAEYETRVSEPARRSRRSDRKRLHLLLVVEGNLVSALRCDPPEIVGDGTSSIGQLIERLNRDPRRNDTVLRRIILDARLGSALTASGLHPDQVPLPGTRIVLPGVNTLERGALLVDVTARVHDSVRQAAVLAAAEHGRTIVGVEFLSADITRSNKRYGKVMATNSSPNLYTHALPDLGRTTAVGDAVLDLIFPADVATRIPTALVVGERGTRPIVLALDRLLRASHEGIGMVTRDKTTIQGQRIDPTSLGRGGPEFLLGDPRVTRVISAISPGKIVRRGLRLDRVSVTALLAPAADGDLDAWRAAVEVCLAASDVVVIGTDHPHAGMILDSVEPGRVLLVTGEQEHPIVVRHEAAGGATIVRGPGADDTIQLRRGDEAIASLAVPWRHASTTETGDREAIGALFTAGLAFAFGEPTPPEPEPTPEVEPTTDAQPEDHPGFVRLPEIRQSDPRARPLRLP